MCIRDRYTNFTFPQYGVRYIAINDNYDTILGKGEVCVQTRQGRVAPQSGQVFCDNDSYTPCFDLDPVSYTHLDVYKRQGAHWLMSFAAA